MIEELKGQTSVKSLVYIGGLFILISLVVVRVMPGFVLKRFKKFLIHVRLSKKGTETKI